MDCFPFNSTNDHLSNQQSDMAEHIDVIWKMHNFKSLRQEYLSYILSVELD
jgi:hypothetical protein